MDKAKRARKAETPKQPSLRLRLRAPYLYPDQHDDGRLAGEFRRPRRDPGRRSDRDRSWWRHPTVAPALHEAWRRPVALRRRSRCADGQSGGRDGAAAHLLRAQDLMMAAVLSINEQVAAM